MQHDIDAEVDANFDAFQLILPDVIDAHRGKFALMKRGRIEGYFASAAVAIAAGRSKFQDGMFSVQEVTDRAVDLGFFSHAVDTRAARTSSTAG